MTWRGGFSGKGLTRDEYKTWLAAQAKPSWVKFLVLHNTGAPNMAQEDATPGGESARVHNFEHYYRDQNHWSGGPHAFVFNSGLIFSGTPLEANGTHSPSWNSSSWGLEMVADFRKGVDDPTTGKGFIVYDTAAWLFAQWLTHLGLTASNTTVKLHKEDKATTHDCPGNLVKKADFLKMVQAYMGTAPVVEKAPEAPQTYVVVDTPGDTLNLRATPSGKVTGTIPDKTKLTVREKDGGWLFVQTPAGYKGWILSKFVDPWVDSKAPPPPPPPPPAPVPDSPALQTPGSFSYSDFCRSWAKRFEGKMLEAYWDRNDYAIGYGHNNGSKLPPPVQKGDTITENEAEAILDKDLAVQAHYVNSYVKVPLTQGQVDALVLHIFQQGPGNFRNGKVCPLINEGKMAEAADKIKNWPTTNVGLIRRRAVEAQIFNGLKPTKW